MVKKKILIIEDEVVLTQALSTYFSINYEVVIANDGEKGLKAVEEFMPNIVLLDIFLPKMNGFDVLKNIKANDKTKNIPVVILSNCGGVSDIKKGAKLGASAYLVKADTELKDIMEKVNSICGK